MYCYQTDIVFQEVPNEVSLVLSISNCPYKCIGCHSVELWKKDNGDLLTIDFLKNLLDKYHSTITCVCFFGGEWHKEHLITLLKLTDSYGLRTCLYTGADEISDDIKKHLTYLKTGPWIESLGGLDSTTTNQRFIEINSGRSMNHYFLKNTTHTEQHGEMNVKANQ